MALFDMRLTPDSTGETFDVAAGMRDVRIWEKTHRGRAYAQLAEPTATALYEIAFGACRRQRLIPDALTEAEFIETYELDLEDPGEKRARLAAEGLRDRIVQGEVEQESESGDPTRSAA